MSGWHMLADQLTNAWTGAMWRAAWQGGLALGAVWLWCRVVAPRRTPARVKCWLWRLAYVKLFVSLAWFAPAGLPLLPAPHDILPDARAAAPAIPRDHAAFVDSPNVQMAPVGALSARPIASRRVPGEVAAPAAPIRGSWLAGAACVWLVGVVIAIARLAAGWRATVQLRRQCTPVVDAGLLALFADLAARHSVRRAPALLQAGGIASPLLLGVRRPAVVLPATLPPCCPPAELRLMLAHELAHLRRHDLLWNILFAAAQALFWFHPLVWLARREWRLAQEVACDESAVALTGSRPADYARALLGVVEHCTQTSARPRLVAVGIFENGRTLERRLRAMKHYPNWTPRRRVLATGAMACLAAVAIPSWRLVARDAPAAQKEGAGARDQVGDETSSPRGRDEIPGIGGDDRPATRPARGAKETPVHGRLAAGGAYTVLGRITAPTVEIKALTGGRIDSTRLEDSRRVKRGDLLVQLDDKLDAAQVMAAEADLKMKMVQLKRTEELYKDLITRGKTNAEILEARANVDIAEIAVKYRQAMLAQYRIEAPFDGVIVSAKAHVGQVITGDGVLAALVDLDHPGVEFAVSERDSTRIAGGAPITLRVPALDRNLTGKVAVVADQVDPATGTVAVKATLDGSPQGIKPGMSAVVSLDAALPATREGRER